MPISSTGNWLAGSNNSTFSYLSLSALSPLSLSPWTFQSPVHFLHLFLWQFSNMKLLCMQREWFACHHSPFSCTAVKLCYCVSPSASSASASSSSHNNNSSSSSRNSESNRISKVSLLISIYLTYKSGISLFVWSCLRFVVIDTCVAPSTLHIFIFSKMIGVNSNAYELFSSYFLVLFFVVASAEPLAIFESTDRPLRPPVGILI